MLFRIHHDSLYRYDVPVALAEHVLRLTPRADGARLISQRLRVDPEPSTWRSEIDEFGNSIVRVSFVGTTQAFHVESEVELETLPRGSLDFALPSLPWSGIGGDAVDTSVRYFAEGLARDVNQQTVAFLDHLTRTLFTGFERNIRPTGSARAAAATLALREGACRDLTVLFLEACRHLGIAGRFVSGYQAQAQTPDGQRHLHAWAEAFLPGVGWRGWDATHGLRVDQGHVALCAAPSQAATMPIEGGFFFQGATVNSTLDHSVRISTS
jgi:transglutaminase-like putative cysteine protease